MVLRSNLRGVTSLVLVVGLLASWSGALGADPRVLLAGLVAGVDGELVAGCFICSLVPVVGLAFTIKGGGFSSVVRCKKISVAALNLSTSVVERGLSW